MELKYNVIRIDETIGGNLEDYVVYNVHLFVRRRVANIEATIDEQIWLIASVITWGIHHETYI